MYKGAVVGTSIGLGAVVGLLLISLVVSIIIHIYCFIKYEYINNYTISMLFMYRLKTYDTTTAKPKK